MSRFAVVAAFVSVFTAPAAAQDRGSTVGCGSQVMGADLSSGFVAVVAGFEHSLGLKADGSIVAWGAGGPGQSDWPRCG